MKTIKVAGFLVVVLLLSMLSVAAEGRWRGGRVAVVQMVGAWGWFGPYGAYGMYRPYGIYQPLGIHERNIGEIKLDVNVKNAKVYLNGAFAGTADKLKSIRLKADAYSLELRAPGYTSFTQKIFVIAGKTVPVHAKLPVEAHS